MALSEKAKCFAREYLVDLNATQAAIRAGYAKRSAANQGYRLLKNTEVQKRIAAGQKARARRTEITADKVLRELANIGFANMDDYTRIIGAERVVDLSALTRDQAAAISEVVIEDFKDGRGKDARDVRRVRFKLLDKRLALVDIGKHLGMFSPKSDETTPGDDYGETQEADALARITSAIARHAGTGTKD